MSTAAIWRRHSADELSTRSCTSMIHLKFWPCCLTIASDLYAAQDLGVHSSKLVVSLRRQLSTRSCAPAEGTSCQLGAAAELIRPEAGSLTCSRLLGARCCVLRQMRRIQTMQLTTQAPLLKLGHILRSRSSWTVLLPLQAHLGQGHEEGPQVGVQVACSAQIAVHLHTSTYEQPAYTHI